MNLRKIVTNVLSWMLATGMAFSASAVTLTPGSGTWVAETTLFGLQNAYVYVPKNTSPAVIGTGRALMLSLHGCGMTASNIINKGYNWEDTAEKYGMVVIAPTVPSGTTATRTYAGCWDWFGGNHSRTTRDEGILLQLINAVKARSNLNIDPQQIYVSGLSSGGGVVNTLACVAPDIFAGAGDNAGPALYTAANAGVGSKATVTAQNVSSVCSQIAGTYSSSLQTQIFAAVNGTSDTTVDPTHDQVQVAGMKLNYAANTSNGTFADVKSSGESWRDANGKTRVSYVQATGMAHAWPAGVGGSGGGLYVDYAHINYPAYVTKFFFDNNLRVSRDAQPLVTNCAGSASSATSATISGAATDNGSITSYQVVLNGATAVNDIAAGSGTSFSKTYNLASGYYSGTVMAVDNLNQVSAACTIPQFLVGSAPAIQAPTGLAASGATANSLTLSWNSVSNAAGYFLYRNAIKVTATAVVTSSYTDTGLNANTSYSYTVSTVDATGAESTPSAAVSGTTLSSWTCSSISASNYAHVQAARAHSSGGYALANGSNQNMGLANVFYVTNLAQTSSGYYVIGTCP